MDNRGQQPLIDVLRRSIAREEERIERAQAEIHKLKLELLELGIELPLHEYEPNARGESLPPRKETHAEG